jgi:GNAT superfamily N-acetyltransferase
MIYKLNCHEFSKISDLFEGHKQYIPVLSIIDGNFPGRVFVDDKDHPATALVWAISRWAYIEGDPLNQPFLQSLAELVSDIVIPVSRQMKMNWFEIYAPNSPEWFPALEKSLEQFGPNRHFEAVFTFDRQKFLNSRKSPAMENKFSISKIYPFILPEAIHGLPFVSDDFKKKRSFGVKLCEGDSVIAICKSNGFISGDEFMVEIETFDKGRRGKGFATAVGTALMDYCLENSYIPLWETTLDNIPSLRLADRLGFVRDKTYPVFAIEF